MVCNKSATVVPVLLNQTYIKYGGAGSKYQEKTPKGGTTQRQEDSGPKQNQDNDGEKQSKENQTEQELKHHVLAPMWPPRP